MVGEVGAMAVMQMKGLCDLSQSKVAKIDRDLRVRETRYRDLRSESRVRRIPVRLPFVQFHHVDTSCKVPISAALALLTRVSSCMSSKGPYLIFWGAMILLFLFQDSVSKSCSQLIT